MKQVITLSLENEMDLVLAHKRSLKVAEKLGLSAATQTTFATAVSEIARTVIEHTNNGNLVIGIEQSKLRFALRAIITFDSDIKFTNADEGIYYAQKLVPEFNMEEGDGVNQIEMKIGLPRSLRLDATKIRIMQDYFSNEAPLNAYEEIKNRNTNLQQITTEQEEEIRRSKIIDEKKNEFISIASHEIKTPITIIKAYSQMARSLNGQCSDRVKAILDKIDVQSSKLNSLVIQLLDISKMENGNLQFAMEKTELTPYILEMVSVMSHLIPNHEITTNLTGNPIVMMDKLRMEQVFSNLLGNAAKYSAKNTGISISATIDEPGFAKIAVTDSGIGMSQTSMHSIFNKFYRDKDVVLTHSGLGMGLYIASKIVVGHGGKIWVESVEGKGSSFFFTVPVILN